MMFHSPYFGMPFYNRYSRYGYRYPYYSYNMGRNNSYDSGHFENNKQEKNITSTSSDINEYNPVNNKSNDNETRATEKDDAPYFQLFGINLYFDDILLVCLILFLYEEGVKDESLFISLILLLLS